MLRSLQTRALSLPKHFFHAPVSVTVVKALFHSTVGLQQLKVDKTARSSKSPTFTDVFTDQELLRWKACQVENSNSIRTRTKWTPEEDQRLLHLVKQHGHSWTYLTNFFVDRPSPTLHNRYKLLTKQLDLGRCSAEELQIIEKFGNGRAYDEIEDWDKLKELPIFANRPLRLIKGVYKHSIDPSIRRGRWTKEESDLLEKYVLQFGEHEMERISQLIGTRTRRQCLERWRWQMSDKKKGRFSPEEDQMILDAVKVYGENFAAVCQVTGIDRTPRHVSQHYHHALNPAIDRSPWSLEEMQQVYETCMANDKSMVKTKQLLDSKRSIRDMWNNFKVYQRRMMKEKHKQAFFEEARRLIFQKTDNNKQ